MSNRRSLTLRAARKAAEVRQLLGKGPGDSVDPIDGAETLGLDIRFVPISSMEGMYYADTPPTVLLPSERPRGRLAFSCAHEIGHHVFGHGSKLDTLISAEPSLTSDLGEWLANMFAAFLLMPKSAVSLGFRNRGWNPSMATPEQILRVAQWLGVGYSALLTQASTTLRLVPAQRASQLRREQPRAIVAGILGKEKSVDVVFADQNWTGRAVDVDTGHLIAVPHETRFEGPVLEPRGSTNAHLLLGAIQPGRGRLLFPGDSAVFVRVCRRDYVGRGRFRFLPDPEFGG